MYKIRSGSKFLAALLLALCLCAAWLPCVSGDEPVGEVVVDEPEPVVYAAWNEGTGSAVILLATFPGGDGVTFIDTVGDAEAEFDHTTATCLSDGSDVYQITSINIWDDFPTLTFSGGTLTKPREKLGHDLTPVSAVAASCGTAGVIAHYHCSRCGLDFAENDAYAAEALTSVEDPALSHVYGEPVFAWADDLSAATAVFTCAREGCPENSEGHTVSVQAAVTDDGAAARCGEAVTKTYTAAASFGGQEYTAQKTQELAALSHVYGEPVFTWADDLSAATAVFTCAREGCPETTEGHSVSVPAAVTDDGAAARCGEAVTKTYTAAASFGGQEYTAQKTQELAALSHVYGEPVFTWAEDLSAATAVFTCAREGCPETAEGHSVSVLAAVTDDGAAARCGEAVTKTYTAVANFGGQDYKEQKTRELAALSHVYGEPVFAWAEDLSSATAVFTCARENCPETAEGHSVSVPAAVTDNGAAPSATEVVQKIYTASVTWNGQTYTEQKTQDLQPVPAPDPDPVDPDPDPVDPNPVQPKTDSSGNQQNNKNGNPPANPNGRIVTGCTPESLGGTLINGQLQDTGDSAGGPEGGGANDNDPSPPLKENTEFQAKQQAQSGSGGSEGDPDSEEEEGVVTFTLGGSGSGTQETSNESSGMRIQHNVAAMDSYRNYGVNNSKISKNLETLYSGYAINRAGDDAAGLAVSEKMRMQISGLEASIKNAKDGIGLVQTAEGALTEVHDMLNRMYYLANEGLRMDLTDEEKAKMKEETANLQSEISRIAATTKYNGKNLFVMSETGDSDFGGIGVSLQLASDAFDGLPDADSQAEQLVAEDSGKQAGGDGALTDQQTMIKNTIDKLSTVQGSLGAMKNRLEHTVFNLTLMKETGQSPESSIRDTDMAEEMMKFTKNNIMNQAAQAMLAQANQTPQSVLQLLQ